MANPAITINEVSKAVASRQLLADVTCTIEQNSLVSLIGPNGAGKSTLIKIILGLDTDYTGSVTIAPRERIQYIPQTSLEGPNQLPLSVHEYLSIGATALYSGLSEQPDLKQTLHHVGVAVDKLLQTITSLSGGERQRVAIARALLADPTMIILDEPVAAVDHHSRQGLYELLRHLQQKHAMTVLLVSHDIDSVLPISDQVLCLNINLHTDCHPADLNPAHTMTSTPIHHHC